MRPRYTVHDVPAVRVAATATGQTPLTPAVTSVLDLLKKSENEVNGGNVDAAIATLGGFKAVWDKLLQ